MYMDFDNRLQKTSSTDLQSVLAEKKEAGKILSRYSRAWQILQTHFLEDLILS
jgi:hypothetical protein